MTTLDNKMMLKLQLLIREADLAAYAYYRESTDEIMLVPAGMPELNDEVAEHMRQGFRMVAAVALMNRETPDGHSLVEFEAAASGVSEEILRKAKAAFCDQLVERGIIKPEPAAQC